MKTTGQGMEPERQEIIDRVREAGVVGAGGGGFPTHAKLALTVELLIANAAECEPLLHKDKELMRVCAGEVAMGLWLAAKAAGARRSTVAIKEKYEGLGASIRKSSPERDIDLHLLPDYYPAGDEFELVYSVRGACIPEAKFPPEVGVLVQNVETLWNVARAMQGLPVTEKFVTVTGAIRNPATFRLPLGMSIREVIDLAGGTTVSKFVTIIGGPMMGVVEDNLETPVTKTTAGIIVLPIGHPLVAKKTLSLDFILKRAQSACIQCCMCTDACPRYLLGHGLEPHRVMRRASQAGLDDPALFREVLLCSACSCCELFACPMHLSPREVCSRLKTRMLASGSRYTGNGSEIVPHPMRFSRRIPARRLISRLGLGQYDRPAPLQDLTVRPRRVTLPLIQHAGAPAEPTVHVGQPVDKMDLVGEIPAGKLGARLHASISGRVSEVGSSIVIEAKA